MANGAHGVLLDVDGTLIDSTYLHAVSWWEAFRQFGHDVTMATLGRAVGMGSDVLIEHVLGSTPEDADDIAAAERVLYRPYWERLRPLPGACELIRACADRGARVVLASSAGEDDVEHTCGVLGCDDYLAASTSSADVSGSKPNPDLVTAALEKAELSAERSAFVGDAVWDVEAAARAGVPCVGIATGVFSQAELAEAGAVATFADAPALLEHLARSGGSVVDALSARRR